MCITLGKIARWRRKVCTDFHRLTISLWEVRGGVGPGGWGRVGWGLCAMRRELAGLNDAASLLFVSVKL